MKGKAVICLAKSTAQAEMIVRNLKDAGCSDSAISGLYAERSGTSEFAHENTLHLPPLTSRRRGLIAPGA